MLLWLVFALLSAGVLAVIVRPLVQQEAPQRFGVNDGAQAVYRDQLQEIDADLQRGLIAPDEAELARAEIGRRLLAAAETLESGGRSQGDAGAQTQAAAAAGSAIPRVSGRAKLVAAGLCVLLPVAAIAAYISNGAPGVPAQPFAERRDDRAPPSAGEVAPQLAKLVGAVEERLRLKPDDAQGWEVIAPVYLQIARYSDAVHAYQRAIALNGESVKRLSGLAEASMLANDGQVPPDARQALSKILKIDPQHVQARFWLAHAKELDGDLAGAKSDYEALLAGSPGDAPWRVMLEQRIAAVGGATPTGPQAETAKPDGAPPVAGQLPASPRGPTQADVAAAETMTTADREAMIASMVAGLAARLEKDGRDLAGWQRLVRAYMVMGRKEDAIAALGRARKVFADEPQSLSELTALARNLGLGS